MHRPLLFYFFNLGLMIMWFLIHFAALLSKRAEPVYIAVSQVGGIDFTAGFKYNYYKLVF